MPLVAHFPEREKCLLRRYFRSKYKRALLTKTFLEMECFDEKKLKKTQNSKRGSKVRPGINRSTAVTGATAPLARMASLTVNAALFLVLFLVVNDFYRISRPPSCVAPTKKKGAASFLCASPLIDGDKWRLAVDLRLDSREGDQPHGSLCQLNVTESSAGQDSVVVCSLELTDDMRKRVR